LLWMSAVKAMGLEYAVSDVSTFGAGVWIFRMGSLAALLRETAAFLSTWCHALGENVYLPMLAFAGLGVWSLWRKGRSPILGLALLSSGVDLAFYFLLHRVHAVYGMNTLALFFALAAEGMVFASARLSERTAIGSKAGSAVPAVLCVLLALALQLALNFRQLPLYGG
jgi:hypothetical protein